MQIQGTTEQLYDMIVQLYNAVFEGTRQFTIKLQILPTANTFLLKDFISLVQDTITDFGAQIDFEVTEDAAIQ